MGLFEFPKIIEDKHGRLLKTVKELEDAAADGMEGIRGVCYCIEYGKRLTGALRYGWNAQKHPGEPFLTCNYVDRGKAARCSCTFFLSSLHPSIQRVFLFFMNAGQSTSRLRSPLETALFRLALTDNILRLPVPLLSLQSAKVEEFLSRICVVKPDEPVDNSRIDAAYDLLYSATLRLQHLRATTTSTTPLPPRRICDSAKVVDSLLDDVKRMLDPVAMEDLLKGLQKKVVEAGSQNDVPLNHACEDSVDEDEEEEDDGGVVASRVTRPLPRSWEDWTAVLGVSLQQPAPAATSMTTSSSAATAAPVASTSRLPPLQDDNGFDEIDGQEVDPSIPQKRGARLRRRQEGIRKKVKKL
ncbi:hypothetical protein JCM10213_000643 [Rhodosporidiobolus nylandii]